MQKLKLAVCIGDVEYAKRFTNCLLSYYRNQFELHIFSNQEQLLEDGKTQFDVLLLSNCLQSLEKIIEKRMEPVVYLLDDDELCETYDEKEGRICFVDKYQEVNKIVDEILKNVGDEIREVHMYGGMMPKSRIVGIYSLSENQYQIPFVVTMAAVLSEQQRVLILDMQENSGFSQFIQREEAPGIEDILVMVEGGTYAKNRLLSCIGHLEHVDYIYPAKNSECLCEANSELYLKLIQMLTKELDYEVIIINFGTRFVGFFEVLNRCQEIYFIQKKNGVTLWREDEFLEEIRRKGEDELLEKISRIELPPLSGPISSCERLVEQWKWNEFGDLIRRMTQKAVSLG